jgi:hypothetical protein
MMCIYDPFFFKQKEPLPFFASQNYYSHETLVFAVGEDISRLILKGWSFNPKATGRRSSLLLVRWGGRVVLFSQNRDCPVLICLIPRRT